MRLTALTVIHKYIRAQMFEVSQTLFRAGPDDVAEVQRVMEEACALLDEHAEREEGMFGPMLGAAPDVAMRLHDEHVRLDAQLAEVRARAKTLSSDDAQCADALLQLQLDWNRVLGLYLLHLDDEERALFTSIEAQLPDVSFIGASVVHFTPADAEAYVQKMKTLTTPREWAAIEAALPRERA